MVWPEILLRLQQDPELTAKSLIERLQREYPGQFAEGQLWILQRRLGEWRRPWPGPLSMRAWMK